PIVMVGAIAGYSAFLTSAFGGAFANWIRARRLLAAGCLLVIPASLIAVSKSVPDWSQPFVDKSLVSDVFAKELGLASGGEWRGSAYMVFRNYREQLTYFTLWDNRIPTHNEASQTSTPLWHYMTFKIMHVRNDGPAVPASLIVPARWDLRLAAALGIRYIM